MPTRFLHNIDYGIYSYLPKDENRWLARFITTQSLVFAGERRVGVGFVSACVELELSKTSVTKSWLVSAPPLLGPVQAEPP